MYCEARTTTGLGCDSLGIEQCDRCQKYPMTPMQAYNAEYAMGKRKPNYPVPAIQYDVMTGRCGVEICRVPDYWDDYSIICETVEFWQRT